MICSSCSRENPDDARFCNECGASLTIREEPEPTPLSTGFTPSENFVGRRPELADLESALEDALSGRGRLLMLVGEPGIGKTRTAQELAFYAERRGAQVFWGRCYEEEGAPPYWPWVQALRSYVLQRDPEPLGSDLGIGAAVISEIVPEIHGKLPGLEPSIDLESPEQARFRLFDSITTFLKAAAHSQPLMLVLDDLHWADKPSLLLLQFLAGQLDGSCLLIVGCYRDVDLSRQHPLAEALGELAREQAFSRVLLRGLSQEEVGRFVGLVSGVNPSRELMEGFHRHTEGNPLFVTEMARLLAQEDELTPQGPGQPGSWTGRIPEGVREVIGRRLNRLSQNCNQTLSVASVIGREFGLEQLHPLMEELPENQLLDVLEEAIAARMIEELPPAVGRYQFTHRLIQETLTEELSLTRRVRLHAQIAAVLEELYGSDGEAHAAELAYHFVQAETVTGTEKLVHYSILAGEQALAAFAYEEALVHFQRGLVAQEAQTTSSAVSGQAVDAQTAVAMFGLARAQAAVGGGFQYEAIPNLQRSFDYYVQVGDVDRAVAVAEFPFYISIGVVTNHAELVSRALTLVEPDSHQAGNLLSTYGLTLYRETGDYEIAEDALTRALAIAQREQDLALELRTLAGAAELAWWSLRLPETVEYGRRAVELSHRVDAPRSGVLARQQMGRALNALGDTEDSLVNCREMLTAAERSRDRGLIGNALTRNAELAFFLGEWQEVTTYSGRGLGESYEPLPLLNISALKHYETGEFNSANAIMELIIERRSSLATRVEGFT